MPAWVVPAAIAAGQALTSLVGKWSENRAAKKRQEEQNEYNSPKNQMARFNDANLNPNLIYGQGNPGNQVQPVPTPKWSELADAIPLYNQTRMTDSQVQANEVSNMKKFSEVEMNQLKGNVLKRNPLLNEDYLTSLIDSMVAQANIKAADANIKGNVAAWMNTQTRKLDGTWSDSKGMQKMDAELNLLLQKFNLGSADQAIKAKVLESKEFQNAILEVQKRFMTDFDITPANYLQFITLFLQKL